ncbi:hypothetical protein ACFYZ8_33205 [Streptomyces sp. NPDC001668]|uniref:hypothetical protein n=1 Tax=Streptomyces sp. NPDC001668 TaxID=3364598 RepID=UPI00368864E5
MEDYLSEHLRRRGYSGAYLLVEPGRSGALLFWERQGWKRADTADQPPTRVMMTKEITS